MLSVSERKALFEKNKGEVLVPKAPFGLAPAVKVESIMKAPTKIFANSSKTNTDVKERRVIKDQTNIVVQKEKQKGPVGTTAAR